MTSFHSSQEALNTVIKVVQKGLQVAALELLDETTMKAVNRSGCCDSDFEEKPTLFMKFSGTPNGREEQLD